MLSGLLIILNIFVCLALIAVVLLQRSEGGAFGMGGGPTGLITARGAGDLLTRTTWILFGIFLALSLGLTLLGAHDRATSSVIEKLKLQQANPNALIQRPTTPAPAAPTPAAPLPGAPLPGAAPASQPPPTSLYAPPPAASAAPPVAAPLPRALAPTRSAHTAARPAHASATLGAAASTPAAAPPAEAAPAPVEAAPAPAPPPPKLNLSPPEPKVDPNAPLPTGRP